MSGFNEDAANQFEEDEINRRHAEVAKDYAPIIKDAQEHVLDEQQEIEWEQGTFRFKGPIQSADLLQWQNSSAKVISRVDADGKFHCCCCTCDVEDDPTEGLGVRSEAGPVEMVAWVVLLLALTAFVVWLLVGGMF